MVRPLSYRWGLSAGGTVPAASSPHLILTPKPTRTVIDAGSLYSWLGGTLLPQHFAWQFLSPLNLLRAQAFCIHEALEVVVICKYENFMLVAFEVVLLCFEHFNDGQQLIVVGLITSLCRNHLFGEKAYRIPSAQIIRDQLTENSTNSIARSIRLNLDMTLQIKMI